MLKQIRLKDVELGYFLTGEQHSETLLFVHGLGANSTQFELQHTHFSQRYRVLSVDLRGHGRSVLKQDLQSDSFQLSHMASDILELLEHLEISQVHYVGNSMGGNVGYEILKIKPDVLKSFTTFGTTGKLSMSKFVLWMVTWLYKLLSPKIIGYMSKVAGRTKESQKKIKTMMSQVNKTALLAILPHLSNFDYLPVVRVSKVPAFIIKGGMDKDINKALSGTIEEFEKRGDFVLNEMKQAGHFANLDDPILFNQTLEDCLLHDKNTLHPLVEY